MQLQGVHKLVQSDGLKTHVSCVYLTSSNFLVVSKWSAAEHGVPKRALKHQLTVWKDWRTR
jgi:hypothetical protein